MLQWQTMSSQAVSIGLITSARGSTLDSSMNGSTVSVCAMRSMAPIRFAGRRRPLSTGNLRAVQILLGHTKIENTVRYLGVDVEDALTLTEGTEIWTTRLLVIREEPDCLAPNPVVSSFELLPGTTRSVPTNRHSLCGPVSS